MILRGLCYVDALFCDWGFLCSGSCMSGVTVGARFREVNRLESTTVEDLDIFVVKFNGYNLSTLMSKLSELTCR